MAQISVLLVDDHAVVREGYRRLLERNDDLRIAGEAGSAADAYREFCRLLPNVVVMDITLPDMSGIELTRRMLSREPGVGVLVFSIHEEPIFATRALQAGALGYITKVSAPDVLVEAVRAVAQGRSFLSQDIAQTLALNALQARGDALSVLSQREFEVVQMLVAGHPIGAIADKLGLSYKTVANHQWTIRSKLGAETATQLLKIAARSGLVAEVAAEQKEK